MGPSTAETRKINGKSAFPQEKRLPTGASEALSFELLGLVAGVRFELTTFGL
jgi:hypothetical protein